MNSISTLIGNSEDKSTKEGENNFSIMSYNVRLFNAYNWIKKEDVENEIFDLFNQRNTNILCIQEFYAPKQLPELDYFFQHIGLQSKKASGTWQFTASSHK